MKISPFSLVAGVIVGIFVERYHRSKIDAVCRRAKEVVSGLKETAQD